MKQKSKKLASLGNIKLSEIQIMFCAFCTKSKTAPAMSRQQLYLPKFAQKNNPNSFLLPYQLTNRPDSVKAFYDAIHSKTTMTLDGMCCFALLRRWKRRERHCMRVFYSRCVHSSKKHPLTIGLMVVVRAKSNMRAPRAKMSITRPRGL